MAAEVAQTVIVTGSARAHRYHSSNQVNVQQLYRLAVRLWLSNLALQVWLCYCLQKNKQTQKFRYFWCTRGCPGPKPAFPCLFRQTRNRQLLAGEP